MKTEWRCNHASTSRTESTRKPASRRREATFWCALLHDGVLLGNIEISNYGAFTVSSDPWECKDCPRAAENCQQMAGAVGVVPQEDYLGNHANHTGHLLAVLGRPRTVLAFPGVAGYREGAIIRYIDIPQQRTVVEERAPRTSLLFSGRLAFVWIQCATWCVVTTPLCLHCRDCRSAL